MRLLLKGLDDVDGRLVVNFYRKTSRLVQLKLGGSEPSVTLRICKGPQELVGDVTISHALGDYRFSASAENERYVLIKLLTKVMREFEVSITTLIDASEL